MAVQELEIQNNIQIWLSNELGRTSDRELSALLKTFADQQMAAAQKITVAPDYGQTAAMVLVQSLSDPQWEFGEYALPLYEALSSWAYHSHRDEIGEIKQALQEYEKKHLRLLSDQDLEWLFARRLIAITEQHPILKELQSRYIIVAHWDDGTWVDNFIAAIEENQELIGSNNLVLDNQEVVPTIANWIRDFRLAIGTAVSQEPGMYDLLKYFNNNRSVAVLKAEEKAQLSEIMRVYFWLHNPVIEEASVDEYERSFESHDEDTSVDEQFFQRLYQFRKSSQPAPVASVDAVKQNSIVSTDPQPWLTSKPKARPQDPDVNLQRILNSGQYGKNTGTGVVFDQTSNIKVEELTQRLEAERQQKQVLIDRKLEELKKRKSSQP